MPFWRAPAGLSERPGAQQSRQPLMIVADDDRDTRELYRAFFDLSGFRTAEASTGSQAVLMARRLVPDVLLMDFVLPDMDGLSVARVLKDDPTTAGIRVLLVTGYSFEGLHRRAAEAGIERALVKPCLPQAMLREVRRALSRPACSSTPSEHALPEGHIAVGDQKHDRTAPVVDPQRQDL
jgi:CheY-like chemotaxis protein